MHNKDTHRKVIVLVISGKAIVLLSLCLHFVILIMFLKNGYMKPCSKFNQLPLDTKNNLPASLKPKKSEFGTFVFFESPPQSQAIPHQLPETPIPNDDNDDDNDEEAEGTDEEPSIEHLIEQNPAVVVAQQEHKIPQKTTKHPEIASKIVNVSVISEEKKLQRIQEIEVHQEAIAKLQQRKIVAENAHEDILKPHKKTEQRKEGKKSIIAMTKGFIENLKDEGDDWLERKGDDNKRPSLEELKFLSYEERINWQLQSSWKRNYAHNQVKVLEGKAVIDFTIDEQGKLVSINLLQSSGNKDLDTLIIQNMHQASPFPPLPKHFNMRTYSSGRIIHVFAHKFGF